MTVLVLGANLIGIGVALILLTVAIPEPSVFDDAPGWLTFGVGPAYVAIALALGTYWITRRTVVALRWAIEGRKPTAAPTSATPFWPPGESPSPTSSCGGSGRLC